ncbi:hypothetical protein OROHE_023501 [Orobanche hederae]
MDKKSWPWRKKSSDKQVAEKAYVSASETSENYQVEKDNNEKPKHVKIPIESYKHLTGLEDRVKCSEEQVQSLKDEVKELNKKLSEARSEMTDKDNMVKQHSKVAEEAVSGWEKAEAEAAVLKNQVESMTLLKLTADDKASHLDGALKECMTKIRNLKEEHDKRVHELDLNKTNLFDKMKLQLESQISNLEQDLMKYASDNAALSRSLQERSNTLIKLSGEKSQAEAEIEYLKSNTESREKEVNSLKYEVHIARKEVEIRNEEKNMSVRSLEVVNKQNLEGAKKIAMLEAECQRLRSLVRKKLPGPGALTQMKHEAERLGRHYGEPRLRSSLDSSLKYQKENELLTERLLAMDKERRILKEALENRNSELEASRSIYAQTADMLHSVEARVQVHVEPKNNQITSKFPVTEDGNVDNVSCAGSWETISPVSKNYYFQTEKTTDIPHKHENINSLDFMYDFLEMEKLAHGSHGSNEAVSNSDVSDNKFITELEVAISSIYDFVMIVDKEAKAAQGTSDEDGLTEKLNMFSAKYGEAINSKINLADFILDVSRVLTYANSERNNALGYRSSKVENSISSDCIDKIALPENKCSPNNRPNFSDSTSESDILSDGSLVPTSESKADSWRCSLEEFEQMKMDKDNLATDFARCTENFESTKSRLVETEQLLDDVRLQLISAQKSNSLAETQLKCMAESYKALEAQEDKLQTEVSFLQGKIENLDNELQEKKSHQDAVTRCNSLLEQLERYCAAADNDETTQEMALTATAEKLAECQETIYLLDKQLKALRPRTNPPNNVRSREVEDETSGIYYTDPSEAYIANPSSSHRTWSEPTLDQLLNGPPSPSEFEPNKQIISPSESKLPNHRPTKSGSSSASSTPTPEKQSRGFSRFFSSKGKNAYV